MIYIPHILNATVLLWVIYYASVKFKLALWIPRPQYSREAWSSAFRYHIPLIVNSILACLVLFVSTGAFAARDYTTASLTIAGFAMYVARAGGRAPYNDVAVPYRNHNFIRVLLPTSHEAGTLYMSPPDGVGIQAVWSYVWPNQIHTSNTLFLSAFAKFRAGLSDRSQLLLALRETATAFVRSTDLDDEHTTNLARWLLLVPFRDEADKAPMEIARETFFYLFHAEFYLFVNRDRIPAELRKLMCKWRNIGTSGANDIGDGPCHGSTGGAEGLREVLTQVALLFGRTPQLGLLDKSPTKKSSLPNYDPSSPEGYAGQLWTYCAQGSESVFAALYVFCEVWVAEMGISKDVCLFGIRAQSKEGDEIMHKIMWRQAWYSAVVAQLIASAPATAGALVRGVLT
jgi:hypothetical protein